jgi:hypothetical protein
MRYEIVQHNDDGTTDVTDCFMSLSFSDGRSLTQGPLGFPMIEINKTGTSILTWLDQITPKGQTIVMHTAGRTAWWVRDEMKPRR